jgi:hypothetical protein
LQSLKRACHSLRTAPAGSALGVRLVLDHLGSSESVNITLKENQNLSQNYGIEHFRIMC